MNNLNWIHKILLLIINTTVKFINSGSQKYGINMINSLKLDWLYSEVKLNAFTVYQLWKPHLMVGTCHPADNHDLSTIFSNSGTVLGREVQIRHLCYTLWAYIQARNWVASTQTKSRWRLSYISHLSNVILFDLLYMSYRIYNILDKIDRNS